MRSHATFSRAKLAQQFYVPFCNSPIACISIDNVEVTINIPTVGLRIEMHHFPDAIAAYRDIRSIVPINSHNTHLMHRVERTRTRFWQTDDKITHCTILKGALCVIVYANPSTSHSRISSPCSSIALGSCAQGRHRLACGSVRVQNAASLSPASSAS